MAEVRGPVTSEKLATAMDTNPVVIRRLLGGLRERGWVTSDKGHGGGWRLSCDLKEVTLGDVHRGLGSPALFTIGHRGENPSCLIEKAVNSALEDALGAAEAVLMKQLDQVSLASLSKKFHERLSARGECKRGIKSHAV